MKEGTQKECYPRGRRDGDFFSSPRTRCLSSAGNLCPSIFLVVRKLLEGFRVAARGGLDLLFQFRGRKFSVFNWLSSSSINEVDLSIMFVGVWVRRKYP